MGLIFCFLAQWVTRVSLSDWLALQARIRGSKDPRLLRDRPSDGAALQQNLCESCGHCVQVYSEHMERHMWSLARLKGGGAYMTTRFCKAISGTPLNNGVIFLFSRPVGHADQSFRLACLPGKNPGV